VALASAAYFTGCNISAQQSNAAHTLTVTATSGLLSHATTVTLNEHSARKQHALLSTECSEPKMTRTPRAHKFARVRPRRNHFTTRKTFYFFGGMGAVV
jgi:hypothetical protein